MRWSVLILALLLGSVPALASGVRRVERQVRAIEYFINSFGRRSFVRHFGNGRLREQHRVHGDESSFARFNAHGVKVEEFARKPLGIFRYQAWYGSGVVREMLLEDDRMVSYDSFFPNGHKYEEYHYNKQKRLKSFYEYNRKGKLVRHP